MQLGLGAPIDGEGDAHSKDDHVAERNAQKSIGATLMELNRVKAGHDDRRGGAQRNHHGGEPGAKPSDGAMPTDFVHTHQRGLKNEEDHPARERGAMNPENERPRHCRMEEIVVDGTLEACDHNHSQQQRHREIEIAAHDPVTTAPGHRADFFLRAQRGPDVFCVDNGHGRVSRDFHSVCPAHESIQIEQPAGHLFGCEQRKRPI